jgi:hypothetical protein
MIASLYEQHLSTSTAPAWAEFPIGYFECDTRCLWNSEVKDGKTLPGVFTFSGKAGIERPKPGTQFLAAFVFDGQRYLYTAELQHDLDDLGQRETWLAQLRLGTTIVQWMSN